MVGNGTLAVVRLVARQVENFFAVVGLVLLGDQAVVSQKVVVISGARGAKVADVAQLYRRSALGKNAGSTMQGMAA